MVWILSRFSFLILAQVFTLSIPALSQETLPSSFIDVSTLQLTSSTEFNGKKFLRFTQKVGELKIAEEHYVVVLDAENNVLTQTGTLLSKELTNSIKQLAPHIAKTPKGTVLAQIKAQGLLKSVRAAIAQEEISPVILIENNQPILAYEYHTNDGLALESKSYFLPDGKLIRHRLISQNQAAQPLNLEGTQIAPLTNTQISVYDGSLLGVFGGMFLSGYKILDNAGVSFPYGLQANKKYQASLNFNLITSIVNYWKARFNRNGYDNKNASISSTILISEKYPSYLLINPVLTSMKDNAAWISFRKGFVFGAGQDVFKNLHLSDDVTAHEYTHAVISHTCDLVYEAESGAINEALADTFAALYTRDFVIGEGALQDKLIKSGIIGLRSLSNPSVENVYSPNPDHYSQKKYANTTNCGNDNDNCGVHTNSGIINKVNYLLIMGFGWKDAETILYSTLNLLKPKSDFADYRSQVKKACLINLRNENRCQLVDRAFEAVGINLSATTPARTTLSGLNTSMFDELRIY